MARRVNIISDDLISREATARSRDVMPEQPMITPDGAAEADASIPHDEPVIAEPNDDPLRRRVTNPVRGLRRIIRKINDLIHPPPSLEELAALDEKKRSQMLAKTLRDEAQVSASRLSRALHELGFSYVRRDVQGNITKSRYVQFDFCESTEDAHWLRVDMDHWPYGCNSDDLAEKRVINHLSRSVQHKVNIRSSPEAGTWFIIERASGMMGIPVHVPIMDMWARMPTTATGLTVPLGMTNNRKPVFDAIDDMVHCMVAGQTGGGKSTLINGWITTLITRNTPKQLQLLLMDMKAGLEFQFFEDVPHLVRMPESVTTDHGIITDPDQVAPAIRWLVNIEAKKRLGLIRDAGHRDLRSYNARRSEANKLPRLVMIIDEWAQARMGEDGKAAEHELAKALQLLRAAGIHLIVCTQTPSKDVLGVLARSNLPTRVAFSCVEMSASILICGDSSAMNLQPAGRAIYKRVSNTPVQVSWISEQMVKDIVTKVKTGQATTVEIQAHDVTLTELLEWGLHENAGNLPYRDIYAAFAHRRITLKEVKDWLRSVEGKTVEVDGHEYTVEPSAGTRGRRLVAKGDSS